MIGAWLRSLTIPWLERGARGSLARTIAAAGDLAAGDAARALRQRLPLTAPDLEAHARNSMLRRRPGETDRAWRLRLATASREMAQQGQVRDVRRRLDLLLGTGAWTLEEFPKNGFHVGHHLGDRRRPVASAPMLVVVSTHQQQRAPSHRFRVGDAVGGDRPVGGTLPAAQARAPDLSYLVDSLDPDITVTTRGFAA